MQNSFSLSCGNDEEISMLWIAEALFLRLNSRTYRGGAKYDFLLYTECTPTVDEVIEVLVSVCLRWSITEEVDRSAVAEEILNNRSKMNVGEWFGVEVFVVICCVVHVVLCNYGFRR